MRVLFTGGGTGGHLYPMLSLARGLMRGENALGDCLPPPHGPLTAPQTRPAGDARTTPEHAVLFVGARANLDEQLVVRDDIPYVMLDSRPLSRSGWFAGVRSLIGNVRALAQAIPVVKHFAPDVIVAAGGYASAPAVVAGALLRAFGGLRRLKIVLLEPNVVPGLANRRLARFADEVWGAYPGTQTALYFNDKFRLTGIPVRADLYAPLAKAEARRSLGLDPHCFTILVFGGSQGARTLNVAVSGMVARRRLPANWQVLHITGARDYDWMAAERKTETNGNRYRLQAYLENMGLAYWAADIAVCRAGASTLAELCTVALPAVLVPYPHATDQHQAANAEYLAERGAALVLPDALATPDALYWLLVDAADAGKLDTMRAALLRLAPAKPVANMVERLISQRIGLPEDTAA